MSKTECTIKAGDILALKLIKGEKNRVPIAYANNGMVCILWKESRGFFPYGSEWSCEVIEVRERSLIFNPIKMLRSIDEVRFDEANELSIKKRDLFISKGKKLLN